MSNVNTYDIWIFTFICLCTDNFLSKPVCLQYVNYVYYLQLFYNHCLPFECTYHALTICVMLLHLTYGRSELWAKFFSSEFLQILTICQAINFISSIMSNFSKLSKTYKLGKKIVVQTIFLFCIGVTFQMDNILNIVRELSIRQKVVRHNFKLLDFPWPPKKNPWEKRKTDWKKENKISMIHSAIFANI